ncbi:MAG: alpha/beta fold hydrolase [Thermoanaerobaculia bacterium]
MRSAIRVVMPLTLVAAAVLHAATEAPVTLAGLPSRFATVDGARVHYKVTGRGRTTLVFVHGWGGEMNVWRDQVPHFASRARVLVLDLPGHGGSDKPESADYSMKYMARALRGVLDDAKVDRAVLVGQSAGTSVIRQFERMYPSRARALVAVDGALRDITPPAAAQNAVAAMKAPDYRDAIAKIVDSTTPAGSLEMREAVKKSALALPQHVAIAFTAAMFDRANWRDDRIVLPLLVINQGGAMWSDDYVQAVRASADDLDYQTMDGVDQFLMLEKPDEFNSRLEKWLVAKKLLR